VLHPHATLIRQYGLHNCTFDPMSLAHAEAFTRVSALRQKQTSVTCANERTRRRVSSKSSTLDCRAVFCSLQQHDESTRARRCVTVDASRP
jgi:hypothetical protein